VKPELRRVGSMQSPVVVIDNFCGSCDQAFAAAEAFAPFPPINRDSYYPGLRRVIDRADEPANAYVEDLCQRSAQFIAGAFDVEGFDLLEASFSMVTAKPSELREAQRAPHIDKTDKKYISLRQYLRNK
jgi:hypothetical protein